MLVRWSGEEQHQEIVTDDDQGLVIARRTWSCDQTVAQFMDQTRLLPKELPRDYLDQVTAVHREVVTNTRGQKVARYIKTKADHYFFAETYDLLAKLVRGGAIADAGGPPPPSVKGGREIENLRRSRWR
jgi:hypothetical protein